MAILGWVFCGLLLPMAWMQGHWHAKNCRLAGITPSSNANAGRILGKAGTLLIMVGLAAVVVMLLFRYAN